MCASMKYQMLSQIFRDTKGCGITWAKMLNVSIAVAYPELRLLDSQCDVGIGALAPLQCLLRKSVINPEEALATLLQTVNDSKDPIVMEFWQLLQQEEGLLREKFKDCELVCTTLGTKPGCMSAGTLQVQLCEYRQWRNFIARKKYGLRKGDPMMNNLPSKRTAGDSKPPARRQKVDNDAQVDGWCFAIVLYVSLFLCLSVCIQSKLKGRTVERLKG